MEGCEPVVLGIFHHAAMESEHGAGAEPQAGIFLNNNSDKFAHMYFGRVVSNGQEDGYLVTQYIGSDNNIIKGKSNPEYTIGSNDGHSGNIRQGVIIDYGGAFIHDAKTNRAVTKRFVDE